MLLVYRNAWIPACSAKCLQTWRDDNFEACARLLWTAHSDFCCGFRHQVDYIDGAREKALALPRRRRAQGDLGPQVTGVTTSDHGIQPLGHQQATAPALPLYWSAALPERSAKRLQI